MHSSQGHPGSSSTANVRAILASIAVGLLGFVFACSKPAASPVMDLPTVESELRAMEAAHRTAIDAKDIDGVLTYYASDLITISSGEPMLYGKEWIRTTLTDLYKTYDFHEDFKFIDIRIIGDRVAASFTYKQSMIPLAGGKPTETFGKGMGIFKKSDQGNWQFEWNSFTVDSTQSVVKE